MNRPACVRQVMKCVFVLHHDCEQTACVMQVMKCVFVLGHDCFLLVKSKVEWLRPKKVKFEAKQQKTNNNNNNKVSADVYFSSVQDGICGLRKAHMRSTPSLKSLPNIAF